MDSRLYVYNESEMKMSNEKDTGNWHIESKYEKLRMNLWRSIMKKVSPRLEQYHTKKIF